MIIVMKAGAEKSKAESIIAELEKKYGFLNKRLKKVDLRASDRMIIQLKNISDLKENDI